MKVILLQDIENLGKKYQVKEVKDGYAKNFLFPQKLARPADKAGLLWLEKQKKILEKEAEESLKKMQELASKLDGIELTFSLKTGEKGTVFGSITKQHIYEKLKEMGFEVKKSNILLEEPIKEIGEFPVKINLEHNLEVEITVIINPEENITEEL